MTDDVITVKLVDTSSFTRRPCTVCGGATEKNYIEAKSDDGVRACEFCLEAGNVDERLAQHAEKLEAFATEIRSLIGRLRVPSFEEWRVAMKKANAEWIDDYLRDNPNLSEEEREKSLREREDWEPYRGGAVS